MVDMCTSSLRALIVAYGWMLPRDVEMVFEYLAIDSGGYRQWWICVQMYKFALSQLRSVYWSPRIKYHPRERIPDGSSAVCASPCD